MGKILFFDIDGTLVEFRGGMPDSSKEALLRAKENGHKIVLCTGRSKKQIYPWLLEIGFDGIVAAAGAYVECEGNVAFRHAMEREAIRKAVRHFRTWGAAYGFQTADAFVVHRDQAEPMHQVFVDMGVSADKIDSIFDGLRKEDGEGFYPKVEKMIYYKSPLAVQQVRELFAPELEVTASSFEEPDETSGEVASAGIHKAYGMQKAIAYFGLCRDDSIAFGDGPNDMEMMQYAKIGVAMGNAVSELKRAAYMVTDDIAQDGVLHAMQKLGLV